MFYLSLIINMKVCNELSTDVFAKQVLAYKFNYRPST